MCGPYSSRKTLLRDLTAQQMTSLGKPGLTNGFSQNTSGLMSQ